MPFLLQASSSHSPQRDLPSVIIASLAPQAAHSPLLTDPSFFTLRMPAVVLPQTGHLGGPPDVFTHSSSSL